MAQPKNAAKDSQGVMTRGELVTEIESLLNKYEAEHARFATKQEVSELRVLLLQIKAEMESQSVRVDALEVGSEQTKNRVEHTARPGF